MARSLQEDIALVLFRVKAERYLRLSDGEGRLLNWSLLGKETWDAAGIVEAEWLAGKAEEL